jgi:hypothetical protein
VACEELLELEAAGEEGAEYVTGGLGFDLALEVGHFFFDAAAAKDAEAAFGVVPSGLGNGLEKNFEQQAAIFFLERGGESGGIGALTYF